MPWLQTYTGKKLSLFNPDESQISMVDISTHLSRLVRFNGATRSEGYTVAQHCVHVCDSLPEEYKLEGLLHDAVEAYTGDIPGPIKNYLGEDFKAIETRLDKLVRGIYNLPPQMSWRVKEEDLNWLWTEKEYLMAFEPEPWPIPKLEPYTLGCFPVWDSSKAKEEFLHRVLKLTTEAKEKE